MTYAAIVPSARIASATLGLIEPALLMYRQGCQLPSGAPLPLAASRAPEREATSSAVRSPGSGTAAGAPETRIEPVPAVLSGVHDDQFPPVMTMRRIWLSAEDTA